MVCRSKMGPEMKPNLSELVESDSLRWVFVGGKGGVGKTTTACSLALEFARRKSKVLLVSTDPAHNTSDAFEQQFGSSPEQVTGVPNLYVMEIKAPGKLSSALGSSGAGLFTEIPDMLQMLPGIDEAMAFLEMFMQIQSLQYSMVVFDTAPTGHTLKLLGFPKLLQVGLEKLHSTPQLKGLFSLFGAQSSGQDSIAEKLQLFEAKTRWVRERFQDPTITTFVCVCIAEFLSVYETERLIQGLIKHEIDTCAIVVNNLIYEEELGEIKPTEEEIKEFENLDLNKFIMLKRKYDK